MCESIAIQIYIKHKVFILNNGPFENKAFYDMKGTMQLLKLIRTTSLHVSLRTLYKLD